MILAWAGVGLVAGAVGLGWGRLVAKVDPVGRPCPGCDGWAGLPRAVLPWAVPVRCPDCRRTVRGPTLVLEGAAATVLAALATVGEGPGLLLGRAWLAVVLVALVWTDARHRLLPASIVRAGGVGSLALLAVAAWWGGASGAVVGEGSPTRALVAGAVGGTVALALHLASPEGLAYGDVRLCALLGLHLGWGSAAAPAWALVLASVAGAGWGLLRPGGGRRSTLPFGPFLVAASAVVLVASAAG